jgi:drug/metabolite transporter (DMT)-like permease
MSNGSTLTSRQKGLIAALSVALCWSFLAILLKYALVFTDSVTIVWYRMLVAFVAMVLWFLWQKRASDLKVLSISPLGPLALAGLALGFNYLGFMKGVHYTSPANTQIFIQLGPLSLAVVGIFLFGETLTRIQMLGFVICSMGFALFFQDRLSLPDTIRESFYIGLTWIILAALAWTLFATIQKRLLLKWKSSQINTYIYLVSSLVFLPWVNWSDLAQCSFSAHLFLIFLGINNLVAYGSLSIAIQNLPLTQVTPIITLNPLLTLVLIAVIDGMGWAFIPKDPISVTGYLGAVLAILGTIIVLSKRKSASSRVRL